MQYILGVHIVNGAGDLLKDRDYVAFGKMLFALTLGYDLGQGAAVRVLHLDEQRIVLDEAAQVADNVGMMQLGEDLHFIHGQIAARWRQLAQVDLLEDNVMAIDFAPVQYGYAKRTLAHHSHLFVVGQLGAGYVQLFLLLDQRQLRRRRHLIDGHCLSQRSAGHVAHVAVGYGKN